MTKTHTVVVVDLGSNSFHLLVARIENSHITLLDTLKEPVRLRMGLQEDGSISSGVRERVDINLPDHAIRWRKKKISPFLDTDWLEQHLPDEIRSGTGAGLLAKE